MCSASSRRPGDRYRHLVPALSTGHQICSTRDACSRHPVTLSVRGRSRLSSSRDSRRTPPTPLCSHRLPLLPHRHAPLLQAPTTQHHSHVPLSHVEPAAEPPYAARNRRSTESAASFGCRGCRPDERHLRPPTCSSVTVATSVRAHLRSMNLEPTLSTSSPPCRRRFPTTNLRRCREPTMVSPSAAYAPNRDPHLRGELLDTSFPGHSWSVSRNRSTSHVPVGNGGSPLFRPSGPKGPSGPSVAHCNIALFLLSFELFKIQFKFCLNFRNL
jgi:hypothetical protein